MANNPGANPQVQQPVVKNNEVLAIVLRVCRSATLPQAVQAALRVARALQCVVEFDWQKDTVVVAPDDTFQGVQRRVQRRRAGDK